MRDSTQPTTPCSLPTRGRADWDLNPLVSLRAQRSLKPAMVKITPPPSLSLDPRFSGRRASLFLVILFPIWEREPEEFRETPKEETHPQRASGSESACKDSNSRYLDPRLSRRGNVFAKEFETLF